MTPPHTIVRKAVSSTSIDPWRRYDFGINNNGTIFLSLSDGVVGSQTAAGTSTAAITGGSWHHLAGTYDGANIKLYIDGVLAGTQALTLVIGDRSGSLFIGTEQVGGGSFFTGLMDQLELYDQALNAGQIQALHLNP